MDHRDPETRTFVAADGYPIHVAIWPSQIEPRGNIVVLHGVQSHGGWYHRLGRTLSSAGYVTSFPDRRWLRRQPAGIAATPSARRLIRRPGRMDTNRAGGTARAALWPSRVSVGSENSR